MKKIIVFLLTFFICLPVFSQSLLFSLIESGVESSQQKKKEKNLQLFENNYNKAVNGNFQKNKIYYNPNKSCYIYDKILNKKDYSNMVICLTTKRIFFNAKEIPFELFLSFCSSLIRYFAMK